MLETVKSDLEQKFRRVLRTPASFDFFVAIHDFIEHIESHASLSKILSRPIEPNPELKIPTKYGYLKQIYQGLEDADDTSDADLGHARYMVLVDLNQIRNNIFSESNSFWKKRELYRKFTSEIYERLNPTLA